MFFDAFPLDSAPDEPEPEEHAAPEWLRSPEDELPALALGPRILGRSDRASLAVGAIEVFSTGIAVPVEAVVRRLGESRRDWQQLMDAVFRHHGPGPLRFGVELADGSSAVTTSGIPGWRVALGGGDGAPAGPLLTMDDRGGGGGGRLIEMHPRLWLWPFPPAGAIRLYAEWPAVGIAETSAELDGAALAAARPSVGSRWADPA